MKFFLPGDSIGQLAELGQALDIGRPVSVFNGGRVGFEHVNDHKEREDVERQDSRGSQSGQGQGTEARQRSAIAGERAVFCGGSAPDAVDQVRESYSGCKVFHDQYGYWLVVPAHPLGEAGPQATFIVAVPKRRRVPIKAWGFWTVGAETRWIGPRHTNYPDGTICAFPPNGDYWKRSDGLRRLIDFFCEWALRHLYLMAFERWPGRQDGPTALYRLEQFTEGDLCTCESSQPYHSCCRPDDLAEVQASAEAAILATLVFTGWTGLGNQRPPIELGQFVSGHRLALPLVSDVYPDTDLGRADPHLSTMIGKRLGGRRR